MKKVELTMLTLKEVAKELRVNERTVFRLIRGENTTGKKLPAIMIGHSWRIRREDLDKFLVDNLNTNTPAKKTKSKKK